MPEQLWGPFVIYVNAYYAVQEAYDGARRMWERPAKGLKEFCHDANPFLWDGESSADEALYEGFRAGFIEHFPELECTAKDGLGYARAWLASMEGGTYGTELVSSLDSVTDERAWEDACEAISDQLVSRAMRLARTPQDVPWPAYEDTPAPEPAPAAGSAPATAGEPEPASASEPAPVLDPPANQATHQPSQADIDAVIAMLARGDEDYANALRARLNEGATAASPEASGA